MTLRDFVADHCQRHPYATTPLQQFAERFKSTLPEEERADWTYRVLAQELTKLNFAVGKGQTMRIEIGGLLLNPLPTDVNCWMVQRGRLVRLPATGVPRSA